MLSSVAALADPLTVVLRRRHASGTRRRRDAPALLESARLSTMRRAVRDPGPLRAGLRRSCVGTTSIGCAAAATGGLSSAASIRSARRDHRGVQPFFALTRSLRLYDAPSSPKEKPNHEADSLCSWTRSTLPDVGRVGVSRGALRRR